MPGVSLSRWTMSYFAAALVALLVAEGLMAAGFGYPFDALRSPRTLIVVHLVAIGWLSLLMCGALFQFVPVLVNRPLSGSVLAMPALVCLLGGFMALLGGFLWLDGAIDAMIPYFPLAAALLGVGFALVITSIAGTLARATPLPMPAHFVALGLGGIALTTALGVIFALVLGGVAENPLLVDLVVDGVPLHAIAGLGGWLALCAMGVSYRLFAMFMLSPDIDRRGTRIGLHMGAAALFVAVLAGIAAILTEGNLQVVLLTAAAAATISLSLYGRDMLHLYRARQRRTLELSMRMASLALGSLALAVATVMLLTALGALESNVAAVVFIVAFGWLSGLGLAKLYKIVPFLTWLECYGPVLGRTPTPRVQDLVVERRAEKWFLLYFAAVWLGFIALLLGHATMFRVAATAMLAGTVGIVIQLLRARRLADVTCSARFPDGAHRPAFFHSFVPKP